MTKNPITITQTKSVEDAAKEMLKHKISVLPVVDDSGELVGILTESDFVGKEVNIPHALASIKELFGQNFYFNDVENIYAEAKTKEIKEVMTKNVKSLPPTATMSELVNLMIKNRIKRVPVLEGDQLVGIITRRDILKAYL